MGFSAEHCARPYTLSQRMPPAALSLAGSRLDYGHSYALLSSCSLPGAY